MRTHLLPLLALAACSSEPADEAAPVDIGNAAGTAQGAIDNYAALPDAPSAPVAAPLSRPTPTPSATPAPTPSPSSGAVPEASVSPDNAQPEP